MATRLRNMKFDEVSFVRRGANQHADVVLYKADCSHDRAGKKDSYCPDCGHGMKVSKIDPMLCDHADCVPGMNYCPECGTDASAIEPEGDMTSEEMAETVEEDTPGAELEEIEHLLVAALKAVQDVERGIGTYDDDPAEEANEDAALAMYVQKAAGGVEASPKYTDTRSKPVLKKSDVPQSLAMYIGGDDDTEITEEEFLKGVIDLASDLIGPDDEGDDTDDVLAKADPEVREIVAKAQAEAEQAIAIAKSEQDRRITAEFVAKARDEYPHLPIDADTFGPVLKSVFDASPENYAEIDRVLKAADSGMSMLFKATGQDAPSSLDGTSLSAIDKAAEAVRAEQPTLTAEQAYDIALRNNPNLYTDALEG